MSPRRVTRFVPLDMRCPECGAAPGERCAWIRDGVDVPRAPHAERVTSAREATAYGRRPHRRPGHRP